MKTEADLDCSIVGFEFTGDPLLEGEFLPLQQGLTVLYGLNGAGKSRLLRGIQAAVTGIRADVELGMVVRLDRSDLDDNWAGKPYERRSIRIALAQAIRGLDERIGTEHLGYQPSEAFDAVPPTERPMMAIDADEVIREHIRRLAGTADPALSDELLGTRLFLLVPTGSREHPSWDAWPVADIALPEAARQLDELRVAVAAFSASAPRDIDPNAPFDNPEFAGLSAEFDAMFEASALVWAARPPRARGRGGVSPSHFAFFAAGTTRVHTMRGLALHGDIDFGIDILTPDADAAAATTSHLASTTELLRWAEAIRARDAPEKPVDSRELFEEVLVDLAHDLTRLADALLQRALPGAPSMRLRVRSRELMFTGPAAEWEFGPHTVGLYDLSSAELRWATRAINHAIHEHRQQFFEPFLTILGWRSGRSTFAILDEPEVALHRTAEADLAAFLVEEHSDVRRSTIVATHSPDLLDARASHTVEVRRSVRPGSGPSQVRRLAASDRDDLARLGLHPSDLLRSTRAFLLVEGVHDEMALRAFLDDRLRSARVEIVTLSGARNLRRTLESSVLYRFTRAKVVAMLDNIRMADVLPVWREAVRIAEEDGPQRGADHIFAELAKNDETGALRSWLGTAISQGHQERVAPFGLERRDVLEYFPAGAFTSRAESWDELRAIRAAEAAKSGVAEHGALKEWISRQFGTDFSGASVEIAIAAVAPRIDPPQEFLDLMTMLESLAEPRLG